MTRQRWDNHGTEFGLWLRTKHQREIGSQTFSAQNLDYIWHNYRENWLITIEEKRYGGTVSAAQADTHGIVEQLLQTASGKTVRTLRGNRPVEYRGHYVITFECTSPEDGWVKVNGKPSSEIDLLELLTTGRLQADRMSR